MVTFKIPLNPLSLLFDLRQRSSLPEQGRSGPKRHPGVGRDRSAIEGGSDLRARDHWQVEGHRDILGMAGSLPQSCRFRLGKNMPYIHGMGAALTRCINDR